MSKVFLSFAILGWIAFTTSLAFGPIAGMFAVLVIFIACAAAEGK